MVFAREGSGPARIQASIQALATTLRNVKIEVFQELTSTLVKALACSLRIDTYSKAPAAIPHPGAASLVLASRSMSAATRRSEPSRWVYRLAICAMLAVFMASLVVFASRPAEGGSFAVIVAPGMGQAGLMRAVAGADGVLVRQSRYPWLAIAAPRNAQTSSTFRAALRGAGALLLLHPALLAGCFNESFSAASARQNS
jgi:hypothetical protein